MLAKLEETEKSFKELQVAAGFAPVHAPLQLKCIHKLPPPAPRCTRQPEPCPFCGCSDTAAGAHG